jgi:hypothetical protein
MKRRTLLLAIAVSGLLCALPAVASAGVWDIQPVEGTFPLKFTASGGQVKLTTSTFTLGCVSQTIEGEYETETTGRITKLVFHECTGPFGSRCTPTFTAPMSFHNIRLEAAPNAQIGILITPKEITNLFTTGLGHFFTYECTGVGAVVGGNGFISEVIKPACGGTYSKEGQLVLESSAPAIQKWQQITTEGTKYDLWSKILTASHVTMSLDATSTVAYERSVRAVCT